jgi:hypothetical protein
MNTFGSAYQKESGSWLELRQELGLDATIPSRTRAFKVTCCILEDEDDDDGDDDLFTWTTAVAEIGQEPQEFGKDEGAVTWVDDLEAMAGITKEVGIEEIAPAVLENMAIEMQGSADEENELERDGNGLEPEDIQVPLEHLPATIENVPAAAKAGCKTPLRGLIHSTTTPFRLFVSSERAPEIPLWIYNRSENIMPQVRHRLKPIPRRPQKPLLIRKHGPGDWVPWPAVSEIFYAPPMPYRTWNKCPWDG